MKAIHGSRITLGELLGHLTKVSRLDDMTAALNPLVDDDILNVVKERETDIGQILEGVETTFRLRHIYAHEFPVTGSVDRALIARSVRAAATFLFALDKGILAIAFSQSAMNRQTVHQLDEVDAELDLLVQELSASLDEKQAARLTKAQKAWRSVRENTSLIAADLEAEGGSMAPMVYNRFAAIMTRNRLQELHDLQQGRW